jgi:hypothetical protein
MWEVHAEQGVWRHQPTEGSNGESVSLFFANRFYTDHLEPADPQQPVRAGEMQNWLNGGREDGVNFSYSGDYIRRTRAKSSAASSS